MALFVDLDDDDVEAHQSAEGYGGVKPLWNGTGPHLSCSDADRALPGTHSREEAHEPAVQETPAKWSPVTAAFRCYPIVMAIAANIDLNTLDNLSRTSRGVRAGLLQYRTMLLRSTLHCSNEDLPVDPEDTLRYRARAGNWFYMEETGRARNWSAKFGHCARDMVAGCRKCGTVICRNCAIKPPAPIVQSKRHRRLCLACQKAPIGKLLKPRLSPDVPLDAYLVQQAICTCSSEGVWLCQPCGRGIRAYDHEYRGIWKWRNQYGEVLGGLGTGIGDADRGVECARKADCCSSKYVEHETDCDAEDAREAEDLLNSPSGSPTPSLYGGSSPRRTWSSSHTSLQSLNRLSSQSLVGLPPEAGGPGDASLAAALAVAARRTPSPAVVGPGYARHEIEGIGGVVKTKRLKMVRVGGCVPEWEDERSEHRILDREVSGHGRSWCGWCDRVIPGKKDLELDAKRRGLSQCKDSA